MAKFATGDVVILVSGSMKMAVESVEGSNVACLWADGGSIHRATLPEAVLDKYIAPERASFNRPDGGRGGPPRGGGFKGGDRDDRGGGGGFNKPKRDFGGGGRPGGGYGGKPGGGPRGDRPRGGPPRGDFKGGDRDG